MVQQQWFSISEVVANLKREYQKLTASMIRFWEKEGLLSPIRTPGGHRKFSIQDIKRTKIIAELRQKRYLPLSVVKHIISRLDQHPAYNLQLFDDIFRPDDYDPNFQFMNPSQAAQETGLTLDQINDIEKLGFLPSLGGDIQDKLIDKEDLQILHFIKEMVELGFTCTDFLFYVEDIKIHINNEAEFWKKARSKFNTTKDRKTIYGKLLSNSSKLRSLLYRKYGGLEIGNVLKSNSPHLEN